MATPKKPSVTKSEAFDFTPGMDPQEYLEAMRKMATEGLSVSQENISKAKAAMDDMHESMKSNIGTAQDHSSKMSMAAIDTIRKTTESAFAHMQALSGVKTIAEAFELQTAFVRKQAEDALASAKDMQELAKGAADDMSKPMLEAADKAAKAFKGE